MLGIKEDGIPTPEQRGMMIQGISKYYSSYTPEEIYLACEMNHYGKFTYRIDHYGKFTIDYMSGCLHLFNEEKKAAILRAKMIEPMRPKPNPIPPDQQRKNEIHRDKQYWDVLVNFVKEQGYRPLYWDWTKVFNYLRETGHLADYDRGRMDDIYREISGKARAAASSERMMADTIGKINYATSTSSEDRIKEMCRKFVVNEVLKFKYPNYICKEKTAENE